MEQEHLKALLSEVDIYVYYDTNTKIVYRTKAVVSGVSEDIAEQEYSKVKNLLSQKYGSDSEDMYVGTKTERNLFHSFLQMMKEK